VTPVRASADTARLLLPRGASGGLTVFIGENAAVPGLTLSGQPAQAPPRGSDLVTRFEVACTAGVHPLVGYTGNTAVFAVAADGFVIDRPAGPLDEDDTIVFNVFGDADVLRTLKVARTSAIRPVGEMRVAGATEAGSLQRQSTAACAHVVTPITDFAPGEGVVTLTTEKGGQPCTSTVSFRVNPLYHGAFGFGPVASWLDDQSYSTLPDSTITRSEGGPAEGRHLLSYTHFIGGPIDLEKEQNVLAPMIGVSLNKPLESVFAGLSFLPRAGFLLVAGAHAAEVTRLDPKADLDIGDQLPAQYTPCRRGRSGRSRPPKKLRRPPIMSF
jgi:hypothetical protein